MSHNMQHDDVHTCIPSIVHNMCITWSATVCVHKASCTEPLFKIFSNVMQKPARVVYNYVPCTIVATLYILCIYIYVCNACVYACIGT